MYNTPAQLVRADKSNPTPIAASLRGSQMSSGSSCDGPSPNSTLWVVPVKGNGGCTCGTPVGELLDILTALSTKFRPNRNRPGRNEQAYRQLC